MTATTRPVGTPVTVSTCTLSRENGRCCVNWTCSGTSSQAAWLRLFQSFRAHFPRHADAVYRGKGRGWSLPLSRRLELEEWTWLHFDADRISGSLAPAPGCVRGCPRGVCYTSPFGQKCCSSCGYAWPVEAGDKVGDNRDTVAALQAERDRLRVQLRVMPDRGRVHGAIKRKLADVDEALSVALERLSSHE